MRFLGRMRNKMRHNPLNLLYDEARLPQAIRRSLNFILLGNICGSAHGIICGGGTAAMIGFATELGANDIAFGVLSAIGQVAALLQLPFSVLVNRTHKRKKYMMTVGLGSRVLWLFFGLIPYIMPMADKQLQLWTVILLLGISSCGGSMINVCWFPWLSDLAPLRIRGRWMSIRESILAAANVCIGLVTAWALDSLPVQTRYVIIFIIGGVVGMLDMIAFGFCEEVYSAPPRRDSLFGAAKEVFKNKRFMNLVLMWTAWCFTANLSGVYLNPYSMNEMGLNFMQIMVFATIASALVSIFAMPVWGKLLDRYGSRNVMMLAASVASLTPLFFLMSSPGNIWPTFLHNALGAMFWCGANLTASNMQLSCSPDETRPTYIAMFSCITALLGTTLGSLAGGALLESWHVSGLTIGFMDRYQILFVLSVILRLSFVLLLVPRFERDSAFTLPAMLRDLMIPLRSIRLRRR